MLETIEKFREDYLHLEALVGGFSPASKVEAAFIRFLEAGEKLQVEFSLDAIISYLVRYDISIDHVRSTSYIAESMCEIELAKEFMNNKKQISQFFDHRYHNMVFAQYKLILEYLPNPPKRILFVGSGAFPSTALILSEAHPELTIDLLDKDSDAVSCAREVVQQYGDSSIRVLDAVSASDFDSYAMYDAIVIAAMVGETEKVKVAIYSEIAKKIASGTHIFTRAGLAGTIGFLCYAPFPFEVLRREYICLAAPQPQPQVKVSDIVLKRI